MHRQRSSASRFFRLRPFSAITAAVLVTLAIAPGALAAVGGAVTGQPASPSRVTHLPPELARLHAKAKALSAAAGGALRGGQAHPVASRSGSLSQAFTVTSPQAIGGDQRLVVSWTPPSGMPSTSTFEAAAYDVTAPSVVAGTCTTASTGTGCSISGLQNAHQYTATVSICDSTGACSTAGSVGATTVARWPDPIQDLTVTAGNQSITATWIPPASNGGLNVDHYIAILTWVGNWCYDYHFDTADVTGTEVTFGATSGRPYVPVNGRAYMVTVFAVNNTADGYNNGNTDCYPNAGVGRDVTSTTEVYPNPVSQAQEGQAGQYFPVDPVSLAGSGGTAVSAGTTITEPLLGQGEVPTTGVAAVTLGVSATSAASGGDVYIWDSDAAQPADPVLVTSAAGATGTVTVPVGPSGSVTLESTVTATIHLDVLGFYQDGSIPSPGSQFVGVPEYSFYDWTAGPSTPISIWYANSIPAQGVRPGASAVVLSVSISGATASGALTLGGNPNSMPDVPTLYYAPGQTVSAVDTVPVSSSESDIGTITENLSAGSAMINVSILGYYTGRDDPSGGDFTPAPQTPLAGGPLAAGGSLTAAWPTGAPALSRAMTEWLLVNYSGVSTAGTLNVYPAGRPGGGVQLSVSAGATGQELVPVPVPALSSGSVVLSGIAAASVTADVVGYTLAGTVPPQLPNFPGGPTNVQAAPLASGAFLSWDPPVSAVGAPVSGYTIIASPGTQTMTVDGSALDAYFYGLTNGISYTFTINASYAITSNGSTITAYGPSVTTAAVTPGPSVPDPPDQPGAQAGDGTALVSWGPPAHDGDSAITGYTINSSPPTTSVTVSASAREAVMTGLTNGTAYTFTVTASNAIGASQPSNPSIPVTPAAGQPIAPAARPLATDSASAGIPQITACGGTAAPAGRPARSGGATVTEYQVDSHIVEVFRPPAGFDAGTAPLATLHQYGFAMDVHDSKALARWRRQIGHSRTVAATPCLVRDGGHPGSGTFTSYSMTPQATGNGRASYGDTWAGLVTTANNLSQQDQAGDPNLRLAGNPFGTVQGGWYVGNFSVQPGTGTNQESSWVGLGGVTGDGLIQAGVSQQNTGPPYPFYELLNSYSDTGAVNPGGLTIRPGDSVVVDIWANDPYRTFPYTVTPAYDQSYADFSLFDLTTHQSVSFRLLGIGPFFNGRTAEWIDEDPTRISWCWHYDIIPYKCSNPYGLLKFTTIRWVDAYAAGTYGNQGAPTNASVYPPPPPSSTCNGPTAPCYNNSYWYKSYMTYPKTGTCEVAVGAIANINTDSEGWTDTWYPRSYNQPCPTPGP